MDKKIVAIIPARGGSKGLPRKNVLPLMGKPVISYIIEAAQLSEYINKVIVSTDDPEIAHASRSYGAQVIERPTEISGDSASSESALLHVLHYLEKTESYKPDLIVFLQCTSPLTQPEDIDGTISMLLLNQADTALTVSENYSFLWRNDSNANAVGVNHDKTQRLPRQQRQPDFIETGAIYVMNAKGFFEAKHRFFGKTVMYEVPKERCFEIDDAKDFKIIESIMDTQSMHFSLCDRAQKIKLVICDVDGVLTDGGMFYSEIGDELKKFNTRDGIGLELLRESGILTAIMTKENTALVERRAKKLKIDYLYQGIFDKGKALFELAGAAGVTLESICYVGDEINDIEALRKVGLACCPADACDAVREICHHRLAMRGGEGCIRELAELIIKCRK